jgi:hypothetical protein
MQQRLFWKCYAIIWVSFNILISSWQIISEMRPEFTSQKLANTWGITEKYRKSVPQLLEVEDFPGLVSQSRGCTCKKISQIALIFPGVTCYLMIYKANFWNCVRMSPILLWNMNLLTLNVAGRPELQVLYVFLMMNQPQVAGTVVRSIPVYAKVERSVFPLLLWSNLSLDQFAF